MNPYRIDHSLYCECDSCLLWWAYEQRLDKSARQAEERQARAKARGLAQPKQGV